MAGSDIKAVFIEADLNAADNVSVATAQLASPSTDTDFTIDGTDASGGVATFAAARIVTVTTAGAGDGTKVVTITGTDLDGDTITESITLPASATTTAGTKYFKTVTAASIDTTPTGDVSIGHAAGAADIVFGGRSRLKGAFIVNGATAGVITFTTNGPDGTEILKLGTVASATAERDVTIPEQGLVFEQGIYIVYQGGTNEVFTNMTVFRA
jgi:hypothetical protein